MKLLKQLASETIDWLLCISVLVLIITIIGIRANHKIELAEQQKKYELIAEEQAHKAELNALANIKAMCDGKKHKKLKPEIIPQLYLGNEFYWCHKVKE